LALLTALLTGGARAGTYSNAFTHANGTTNLGDGTTLASSGNSTGDGFAIACVINNALRLADKATGSRNTGFVIPSVDGAAALESLTVRFDLNFQRIGADTPADGFSFSYGAGLSGTTGETGFLTASGFSVGWDTYSNGDTDPIAVDVHADGAQVATVTAQSLFGGAAPFFPYDTTFRRVEIHWDSAGLDVRYLNDPLNPGDDLIVVEDLELPGFQPLGGESFAFGARTGGAKQDVFLDNLVISTVPTTFIGLPETGGPVISEFMAENADSYEDEDRDTPDWIEIYNGTNTAVNLAGWTLTHTTTNGTLSGSWTFPSVPLPAYGYLLVFASGKDRTTFQNVYLHTSFTLPRTGGTLRLLRPDTSPASTLPYPAQTADVPYGYLHFDQPPGFLENLTLRARNLGRIAPNPPLPDPVFSLPSQVRTSATNLVISLPAGAPTGTVIRTSTSGNPPAESSSLYTTPIAVNASLNLRARLFHPDHLPSRAPSRVFVFLATDLHADYNSSGQPFSSNLPVLVLDSFGRNIDNLSNPNNDRPFRFTQAALYDPDPGTGRTSLGAAPTAVHRAATHVRGQSSSGLPQRPYSLEFWQDHADTDLDVEVFGMPAESDWVLHSPGLDKTLFRNELAYATLREAAGQGAAMRTRYVEVFFNQDGGPVGYGDYRGVYLLVEKIKRTSDRLGLQKINDAMADPALISGGYVFKIDKTPLEQPITTAGSGAPWGSRTWQIQEPEPATTPQMNWLKAHLDQVDQALMAADFAQPASANHYEKWLDSGSFINRFWFQELFKEVDSFIFSYYLSKDRGQRVRAVPMWDLDRGIGNANYGHADSEVGFLTWRSNYPHYPRLQADPEYVLRQWDRWWELRRGVLSDAALTQRLENVVALLTDGGDASLVTNTSAPALQNPVSRHFRRWSTLGTNSHGSGIVGQVDRNTYRKEVDAAKTWLLRRLQWIDGTSPLRPPEALAGTTLSPLPAGPHAVGTTVGLADPLGNRSVVYTLNGPDPRDFGGAVNAGADTAVGPGVTTVTTHVAAGSTWRWLMPASAPSATWKNAGFDDTTWSQNTSPLFYNESISPGTNISPTPPTGTGSSGPAPVYVRKTFSVADAAAVARLWVELRADDGAVVYVNGQEAARVNMPLLLPVGHGTTNPTAAGGVYALACGPQDTGLFETSYKHLELDPALLVSGANTIAISVHQAAANGNADLQFDCRVLTTTRQAPTAAFPLDTPGFHVLRARVRDGSTWGPLLETTLEVDTVPPTAGDLVISEIHYHPAVPTPDELAAGYLEDNDFEFIELLNVSAQVLDLSGVAFTQGISFSFASAAPADRFLAPGARVVLARHPAALLARHPAAAIAGTYDGSLSNSGETLVLSDAEEEILTAVTYSDLPPWPTTPDGQGPSLVYNHPFAQPDPNLPSSWRPSHAVHGAAGGTDAAPYPIDPYGDSNANGRPDLLEYALAPQHTVQVVLGPHTPPGGPTADHLWVSARRRLDADGFTLVPERSGNLSAWDAPAFTYLGLTDHGDGTATLSWRSLAPASAGSPDYVRLRVQP
jgi:hypothetical protein